MAQMNCLGREYVAGMLIYLCLQLFTVLRGKIAQTEACFIVETGFLYIPYLCRCDYAYCTTIYTNAFVYLIYMYVSVNMRT